MRDLDLRFDRFTDCSFDQFHDARIADGVRDLDCETDFIKRGELGFRSGRQFLLDAAYKRYDMHGLDGATPQSSYAQGNVYTVGLRWHF